MISQVRAWAAKAAVAVCTLGTVGTLAAAGMGDGPLAEVAQELGLDSVGEASSRIVWYPTSDHARAYWADHDPDYADSDREMHDDLLDDTLTDVAMWVADSIDGSAAETQGGTLPEMGLLMTLDDTGTAVPVCSATIVTSPTRDRVLTAAHCLDGVTSDLVFIPDYHDGQAPLGVWDVTAAAIDPRYGTSPSGDQAVLVIADRGGEKIEDAVGSLDPAYDVSPNRSSVIMAGYPYATVEPRLCRSSTSAYSEAGDTFLAMHCAAMPSGVSGGPWLSETDDVVIIGVTGGGADGGGYTDDDSVATRLSESTRQLIEGTVTRHEHRILASTIR
ncbi:trypsin-like peptidase domain-containing protein [Nanchangia anserum]|uniref:Trypsin-like peptidase domain-containing protein n=1 Tax=Nanchangia anserum TaxID=2692125 RepID=A0A8I0GD52_9ACTO|nr:trypsin-like peptidase domain-containing protein [Nanchangia anserum]MBD3689358.1 trypsin-like peptidase domain-containing protein [Nanchangia anserum]QOX81564.1 trypsin-like peptidase domain-containing protein [Nanchangia anserum]